jgi:hypothetical protein
LTHGDVHDSRSRNAIRARKPAAPQQLSGNVVSAFPLRYLISLINLWFERLRGRATSIAMMGLAAGGFIVPSVAEYVIAGYGWRAAYWILGSAVVLIMLTTGLLLYRDRPRSYGLLPDFGRVGVAAEAPKDATGLTLGEVVHTRGFGISPRLGFWSMRLEPRSCSTMSARCRWSHDKQDDEQIFFRGPRPCGADGSGSRRRTRLALGSGDVDRDQDRLHAADAQ